MTCDFHSRKLVRESRTVIALANVAGVGRDMIDAIGEEVIAPVVWVERAPEEPMAARIERGRVGFRDRALIPSELSRYRPIQNLAVVSFVYIAKMAWITSTWINLDPTNQQLPNIQRYDSIG